jgi:ABC-2 type transport system ATP-binding protein
MVRGRDPAREGAAVRGEIGYVPEDGTWPFARQRLDRFLGYHAAYRQHWDPDYAMHLSGELGLRPDRRFGSASKGEVRRAQLVAALAHRPPVLLLDEPTDGLDPVVRRRLLEILAAHLAETPTTVVASTHQLGELEQLADHVVVMESGSVIKALDREELRRTVLELTFVRPPGFAMPSLEGVRLLSRHSLGSQERWLVEGQTDALLRRLTTMGVSVPAPRPVSLEDAAIALLSRQGPELEVVP